MQRVDIDEQQWSEHFSARLIDQGPGITVALEGELDLHAGDDVRRMIVDAFSREPERVILDLSRLTFMDSTGVHAAVGADTLARATEIPLLLIPGSRAVQRIFEFAELGNVLPFR
jgi:anti-anti-sigma factor